jgi:hypothetical protein
VRAILELPYSLIADALDVRLVNDDGVSLTQVLAAVGALASPVIALGALWITWLTIKNDRQQRALERNQDWLKQLQEQQLTTSAEFAYQAFQSLVELERLDPLVHEPSPAQLAESRERLELTRREMSKPQLLFGGTGIQADIQAGETAQKLVDALNSAQVALEQRRAIADESARADQQADYARYLGSANDEYVTFLRDAKTAITSPPGYRTSVGD